MDASYPGYPLTGPLKAPAPAPAPSPINHREPEVPRQDSASNKHITPDREKGTGSNKRQKMDNSRTSMSYPRKRAVTACQLCRTRKTKCNNARPRCKLCQDLGAECLYEDRSDHSSFDPASLMMLERLNTIIERLDTIAPASAPPINTPHSAGQTPAGFLQSHNGDLDDDQDGEYMRIHSSEMSPDRVLQWPIFEGRYEPECLAKALFETQGGSENLEDPLHGRMCSDLEERIPSLIETFLGYVHIKNPILDPHTLKSYARHVTQEGFGWDAISCLVLIACALGALAEPFDSTLHIYAQPSPIHEKDSLEISRDSLFIASKYFTMSRKRIGLLDATIIRCQCYLLSGVYLMYTLRPLEAWQNFLQASTSYHVYLKGQSRLNKTAESPISPTRLLEQRLFFSCFKSECEIRVELSLPESGLFSIKYPDMFPSPPIESSEAEDLLPISLSDRSTNAHQEANNTVKSRAPCFKQNLKQSWYYYYTEISLRRLGNSILKEFYKSDQPCSGLSIPEMLTMAAGFDEQFSQLHAKVPPIIAYDQNGSGKVPDEELPYFLRARQLDCMLWFMRPFLYHALHNPYDDPYRPLIQNYVDRCLSLSASMIKSMAIRHRHHGTWLSIRHGTSCALSLLAAAKCGHIAMPTDWKTAIYTHVETYKFWEKESPDIVITRKIVEALLNEVT